MKRKGRQSADRKRLLQLERYQSWDRRSSWFIVALIAIVGIAAAVVWSVGDSTPWSFRLLKARRDRLSGGLASPDQADRIRALTELSSGALSSQQEVDAILRFADENPCMSASEWSLLVRIIAQNDGILIDSVIERRIELCENAAAAGPDADQRRLCLDSILCAVLPAYLESAELTGDACSCRELRSRTEQIRAASCRGSLPISPRPMPKPTAPMPRSLNRWGR